MFSQIQHFSIKFEYKIAVTDLANQAEDQINIGANLHFNNNNLSGITKWNWQ